LLFELISHSNSCCQHGQPTFDLKRFIDQSSNFLRALPMKLSAPLIAAEACFTCILSTEFNTYYMKFIVQFLDIQVGKDGPYECTFA
jgi:hypothetical protein